MEIFKNLKWPLSWNWTQPNNRHKKANFYVMLCQIVMIHILVLEMPCLADFPSDLVVKTTKGYIEGATLKADNNRGVHVWKGIPYAKPPIANLRFRRPLPMDPWDGIKNTTKKPNTCFQLVDPNGHPKWKPNTKLSEDCLYLSVAVPQQEVPEAEVPEGPSPIRKPLPVMLYIHGGAFLSGTSTLEVLDPKLLASSEEVIVVSVQYRLASLGFLYFGTAEVPGNVGLYDQLMAIEWVQKNIAAFGGDPKRVTIFGQSAGAVSVGHHLMSPLSRDKFQQAIMQSGSPLSNWGTISKEQGLRNGLKLAKALKCPSNNTQFDKILNCLQSKPALHLLYAEFRAFNLKSLNLPFVPVVDGTFITQTPEESLEGGNFKSTNILTGVNQDEGSIFLFNLLPEIFKRVEKVSVNSAQFEESVKKLNRDATELDLEAIKHVYTNRSDPNSDSKYVDALIQMAGDYSFTWPTLKFPKAFARRGSNVFAYLLAQRPSASYLPKWAGVIHSDELNYIFGEPLKRNTNYNQGDIDLSKRIMSYWGNFAKTGNPGMTEGGQQTFDWPKYKPSAWKVAELKARSPHQTDRIISNFKSKESSLWDLVALRPKTGGSN